MGYTQKLFLHMGYNLPLSQPFLPDSSLLLYLSCYFEGAEEVGLHQSSCIWAAPAWAVLGQGAGTTLEGPEPCCMPGQQLRLCAKAAVWPH